MSTVVIESLEKCLRDLSANRTQLAGQIEANKLKLEVDQVQLEAFDVIIATTQVALGDANMIAQIEALRSAPPAPEASPAPLNNAGGSSAEAPAPAGSDDSQGPALN